MADAFLYESSLMTDVPVKPFLEKKNVYVQDSMQTSAYTG